jgi:hypothetical protein
MADYKFQRIPTILTMNSTANNASSYGTRPTVSSSDELLTSATACGTADPTHTPIVPTQIYTNTTSGQRWTWINSGWIKG